MKKKTTTDKTSNIKKEVDILKKEIKELKKMLIIPDYILDQGWEDTKKWLKNNKKNNEIL